MSDLITLTNQASMTSKEIADLVGSRHTDVKRSIERLMEQKIIAQVPLAFMQEIKGNNRTYDIGYYNFTGEQGKRDTIIIVAQIKPEVTAKIVDRWLELENKNIVPSNYIEALKQVIQREEEKQLLLQRNEQLAHQKECAKLENGKSVYGASIKQVNVKTGDTFSWRPLAKWCEENDIEPQIIYPNGYGSLPANVYPSQAWDEVYQVDLDFLFKE